MCKIENDILINDRANKETKFLALENIKINYCLALLQSAVLPSNVNLKVA